MWKAIELKKSNLQDGDRIIRKDGSIRFYHKKSNEYRKSYDSDIGNGGWIGADRYNEKLEYIHGDKELDFVKAQRNFPKPEESKEPKYMVFVEGRGGPKKRHNTYKSAETEAQRLSTQKDNIGKDVIILEIISTFKSKVITEKVK